MVGVECLTCPQFLDADKRHAILLNCNQFKTVPDIDKNSPPIEGFTLGSLRYTGLGTKHRPNLLTDNDNELFATTITIY